MFFRKKLNTARSNFLRAYQDLMDEISNVKLIKPYHVGVVHLTRLYEEIIDHTTGMGDDVMRSSSLNTISTATKIVVSYTDILHHVYGYYYELNEDPNRFNTERN